jgi:hypothetical protein
MLLVNNILINKGTSHIRGAGSGEAVFTQPAQLTFFSPESRRFRNAAHVIAHQISPLPILVRNY